MTKAEPETSEARARITAWKIVEVVFVLVTEKGGVVRKLVCA